MSKKAVFEVATLQDAVAKANRIAPNKGAAHDRAAGILVEIDPWDTDRAVIKSTDLDVSFRQVVSVLETGDEKATWRVPAGLFNGIMSTMPMGIGSTVTLQEMSKKPDGMLYFVSGKMKAKLRLIVGDYPTIPKFDSSLLQAVPNLAKRLQQVAWACDNKGDGVLSGVHLDGEFLYGCNRTVVAIVPCKVPVDRPVTAPLFDVAALIKNASEVQLRAGDNSIEIMPDDWTQSTCTLFGEPYPNIKQLMKDEFNGKAIIDRETFITVLDQMLVLVKSEKFPRTAIEIDEGIIRVSMEVPDVGKVANEFEVQGGQTGGKPKFEFLFSPLTIKDALIASGRQEVTLDYGPTSLHPVRITDDNGFLALAMPMRG